MSIMSPSRRTANIDGYQFRNLNPGELAQIAGRAGRHLRDGTFGVTSRVEPFDDELVQRIESHQFDQREGAAVALEGARLRVACRR